MPEKARLLRGFQDFLPEQMLARNNLIATVRQNFERFGFLPQDTPRLEYADLLLGKYGENEKLIYEFRDKGNRHVALRYDLTVPLTRVIQMYGHRLSFPYRRYQIGMVWRADKPGKGRYREFLQIDADIVGDSSLLADVEMVLLTIRIMQSLNVRALVRINCRQILEALLQTCGLTAASGAPVLRAIDKFERIGFAGVKEELRESGCAPSAIAKVEEYLSAQGPNEQVLANLQTLLKQTANLQGGVERLAGIVATLNALDDAARWVKIDPSIARGLDYYTGLIFETTFLDDPDFGSVCSGGRYDRLIRLPSGEFASAIGTSIGLDRLFAAMDSAGLLPKTRTITQVLIANFAQDGLAEYLRLANELRSGGLAVEIFPQPVKLAKQLKFANDKGIAMAVFMGPDEMSTNQVVVKSMTDGWQEAVARQDVVAYLRQRLMPVL